MDTESSRTTQLNPSIRTPLILRGPNTASGLKCPYLKSSPYHEVQDRILAGKCFVLMELHVALTRPRIKLHRHSGMHETHDRIP